jgi:hypothetical protein
MFRPSYGNNFMFRFYGNTMRWIVYIRSKDSSYIFSTLINEFTPFLNLLHGMSPTPQEIFKIQLYLLIA